MNRFTAIAAAAVMVIAAASCSKTSKEEQGTTLKEAEDIFQSELQTADTTQVLELGNAFMETLKNGKIDEAIDMLYTREMTDSMGTPRKLNENERASLKSRFEHFPVVSYEIDHYDFSIPSLNDLKYSYTFNPGSVTGKLNIMFNPMKRDGQWYLMLKQPDQPAKDAKNALDSTAIINMD